MQLTMQHRTFLLAIFSTALMACARAPSAPSPGPEVDRAIVAAALEYFANSKDAAFEGREGVLEVAQYSAAGEHWAPALIRANAPEISDVLDDDLVAAFVLRNRSRVKVEALISGLPWARPQPPSTYNKHRSEIPEGIKAIGSITLPGVSSDGSRALIQIHHAWAAHGAVTTYVMARKDGEWEVVKRDVRVLLLSY
jgi:hypothetical protein